MTSNIEKEGFEHIMQLHKVLGLEGTPLAIAHDISLKDKCNAAIEGLEEAVRNIGIIRDIIRDKTGGGGKGGKYALAKELSVIIKNAGYMLDSLLPEIEDIPEGVYEDF